MSRAARGTETDERVADLMDELAPRLLSYFARRAEAPLEAADLLHETLTVVWRRRRDVPEVRDEAVMWVFGVARRTLLTGARRSRRRSALHQRLVETLGDQSVPPPDPGHLDLRDALRKLSTTDQEIIRLAYWDGFSLRDVARLLDMSEGTVRSRHHRARQQLRQTLGTREDDARCADAG